MRCTMDERKASAPIVGCGRVKERCPVVGNPWASAILIPIGIIAHPPDEESPHKPRHHKFEDELGPALASQC